jgi:hypothetical protein
VHRAEQPRAGRRALTAVVVVVAGLGLTAAGRTPVAGPLRGRVVDRDTGRPIAGAGVRLHTTAHCPRLLHGWTTHRDPVREARTDAEGRFTLPQRRLGLPPCVAPPPLWADELQIVAPGYRPESWADSGAHFRFDRPVRAGVFTLEPLRYRLEVEAVRARWAGAEGEGGAWGALVGRARRVAVRPVGPPGVVVAEPGRRFERIALTRAGQEIRDPRRPVIVVQDGASGVVRAWTSRGDPVPLPWAAGPGLWLGGDRSTDPVVATATGLYVPRSEEAVHQPLEGALWVRVASPARSLRSVVYAGDLWTLDEASGQVVSYPRARSGGVPVGGALPAVVWDLAALVPGARPPVACLTTVWGPDEFLVVVAQGPGGPTTWVAPTHALHRTPWDAEAVSVPPEVAGRRIVSCAGGRGVLYLALDDGGLRALRRLAPPGRPTAWALGAELGRPAAEPPRAVRGLAVGWEAAREVVYAVAGDGAVYRVAADGTPDQRVEVGPPAGGE